MFPLTLKFPLISSVGVLLSCDLDELAMISIEVQQARVYFHESIAKRADGSLSLCHC